MAYRRWQALMAQYKGEIDAELGKSFVADQFEQALRKIHPGGFVLMARMEISNRPEVPGVVAPRPFGANEGKVVTAALARDMSFWARMGNPDGSPFSWGADDRTWAHARADASAPFPDR